MLLFLKSIISRNGPFREFCRRIVTSQYGNNKNLTSGSGYFSIGGYFSIVDLLSLIPYVDWFMLLLTICSCGFMLTENHDKRLTDPNNTDLQIMEYFFIFCMTTELFLKICAQGLIFTPEAMLASPGGVIDLLIYTASVSFFFLPE